MAELEGVDMAVLGSEGRGGGRGHIEEPEAHRFKRQWNVAVPLLLSFRLFFILGNLGRPPAKRDWLRACGEGTAGALLMV